MKVARIAALIFTLVLLGGCASNVIPSFSPSPDYGSLYLRGVFTWWEADDKYKLKEISNNVYATQIELIADGQPYDFKFADATWSPNLNCGYAYLSDQNVKLNERVKADCETSDQNFKFTPNKTGLFEFSIDFNGFGSPRILVRQVSS